MLKLRKHAAQRWIGYFLNRFLNAIDDSFVVAR